MVRIKIYTLIYIINKDLMWSKILNTLCHKLYGEIIQKRVDTSVCITQFSCPIATANITLYIKYTPKIFFKKWEFPGGPLAETVCPQCRGPRFDP